MHPGPLVRNTMHNVYVLFFHMHTDTVIAKDGEDPKVQMGPKTVTAMGWVEGGRELQEVHQEEGDEP